MGVGKRLTSSLVSIHMYALNFLATKFVAFGVSIFATIFFFFFDVVIALSTCNLGVGL